jgi:hypothetical protein
MFFAHALPAPPYPRTERPGLVRSLRSPAHSVVARRREGRRPSRTRSSRSGASGPGGRGRPGRPLPETAGLTQKWISSASPCLAGSYPSSPQPKEIRFPRCRALMLVTLSASSPLINDAFQSRGSSRVREATYLGTRLTRSAKPVSSVMVGQTLAGPSYRPCARAGMRPRPGAKSNSYRSPSPSRIAHRSGEGPMTPSRVMWVEMITFPWDLHSRARSVAGPAENLRLARTT